MAVACETDAQWHALAPIVGLAGLAELSEAERRDRADELETAIAAWAAGKDPADVQELLQAADVPAHQVQNSAECVADPQLVLREQFRSVPYPIYGNSFVEGPAFTMSATPGGPRWAGPTMGQHTQEVLSTLLGYSDEQITELVIAGALE